MGSEIGIKVNRVLIQTWDQHDEFPPDEWKSVHIWKGILLVVRLVMLIIGATKNKVVIKLCPVLLLWDTTNTNTHMYIKQEK